ncbi:MAG: fibronectin-binding domain-containing protein [Thermoplasmata archaeon]|nr:MAG: fibronectin-binding domain-containing protein [Thermoplasmata archaeon]
MTLFVCVKERMDSFDVSAIVREMQEIVGGWVGKIYQNEDEVAIKVRKEGNKIIFIKNGKWIFMADSRDESKEHPPTFAMTLRKYLNNKKITSIEQVGFDRVVVIKFSNSYALIIELFSDGNIILVDDDGKILLPIKFRSWSHREIRPKQEYVFPPARTNPFDLSFESFFKILKKSDKDLIRTMVMDVNIPGIWGEEICETAGIEKNMPSSEIDEKDALKIYDSMNNLLSRLAEGNFEPVILESREGYENVLPFPLKKGEGYRAIRFDSFNAAVDDFYFKNFYAKKETVKNTERERLLRQLNQQQDAIKKFEQEAEKKKNEGDAIYANYALCEEIINKVKEGDYEEKRNFVKKYVYPELVIELPYDGRTVEVCMDVRKSVAQNANEKYNESKKAREKIEGAKEAIEKTLDKLKKCKEEVIERQIKKSAKKFWFEDYRWFISSDGNLVIGGKDASSNEKIVKKYMKAGDRYVHADIHGAPSCVVKAADIEGNEMEISEKTLAEACQFALSYSKAWNLFGSGSAYWVKPEQVSKTPESGEYVPKGAFVIRGKRNYVKCDVEIAIGKVNIQGYEKIMGGAPSAVKKRAEKWIVIKHGEADKNKMAKEMAKKFGVGIEDMQRVLPPGSIMIKEENL